MSEGLLSQFDPEAVGAVPEPTAPVETSSLLSAYDPGIVGELPPESTATGSFVRGAERGLLPSLGGMAAAGAGAELGALAGAPLGPIGAAVGGIVGGLGGAVGGGSLVAAAQNYAISKAPETWVEKLGQDERQQQLDEAQHPYASFLGGVAPFVLTMRPGSAPKINLPENATAIQRVMANPMTARIFGGGAMGGMELGSELVHGEAPDWTKVGVSTGMGLVLNRPTRLGEYLTNMGARPFRPATLAEAHDMKVMGPGVTESVFRGAHEMDPEAGKTAAETRRSEMEVLGEVTAPDADLHAAARAADPELFARYDDLTAKRDELSAWLSENPGSQQVGDYLRSVTAELRDMGGEVSAAYRRAADLTGGGVVEPMAAVDDGLSAQKAYIAEDVTRQLIAAGRPDAEAKAAGQLIAERYATRASRFGGKLGTAEELYNREGARIVGAGGAPAAPAAMPEPVAPVPMAEKPIKASDFGKAAKPDKEISLLEFLSMKGLAPSPELAAIFDKENPRYGKTGVVKQGGEKLIRDGGYTIDDALRAASEAGYFHDPAMVNEGQLSLTPSDLLDAIRAEHFGEKLYPSDKGAFVNLAAAEKETKAYNAEMRTERQKVLDGLPLGGWEDEFITTVDGKNTLDRAADYLRTGEETNPRAAWNRSYEEYMNEQIIAAEPVEYQPSPLDEFYQIKPDVARKLPYEKRIPDDQNFKRAVEATPGARLDDDGLHLSLTRWQKGEQEGQESVRTGVFYLPSGHKNLRHYKSTSGNNYGGDFAITGETLLRAPLFVKGATGGKAPEAAYDAIKGKGAMKKLDSAVFSVVNERGWMQRQDADVFEERVANFLTENGADGSIARYLIENSKKGNQLRYALQENIIAHAVRNAGYDSVVGYSVGRDAQKTPTISEVFDVRETHYPANWMDAKVHPKFAGDEFYQRQTKVEISTDGSIKVDGETVGKVKIDETDKFIRVSNIEINPASRNAGIGSDAIRQIQADAASKGKPVVLTTDAMRGKEAQTAQRRLYERLGFVKNKGKEAVSETVGGKAVREEYVWKPEEFYQVDSELRAKFMERISRARSRGEAATKLVEEAIASKKPSLILEDGDKKLILSNGMGEYPYRMTSFDKDGPIGHREYGENDVRFMADEVSSALYGGWKVRGRQPEEFAQFYKDGQDVSQKTLDQSAKGKITFRPGQKPIITLMRDADASTFIHETGHDFLEQMLRDAKHEAAPDILKEDAQTILNWLGAKSAGEVRTKHHEKFARGFEQYLREGVAPSKELAGVFAKFKQWLVRLYETIRGLGAPISDDIRQVFDRMLAEEPQRTVIAPELERQPTIHDIHETDARLTEPAEAGPAADRVAAERERAIAEVPGDIADEIRAEVTAIDERNGTARTGGGGTGEMAGGGVEPQPVAQGRDMGAGNRALGVGGSDAAPEGAGLFADNLPLSPRPRPILGAAEPKFTDKAGNIRVENLTTSEDVANAIHEAAAANDEFTAARRGVVSDGQVMDLASDIGLDGAFDLVQGWVKGRAYNAEQVMALRKLLVDSAQKVHAAMQKAATGTDQDILAYAMARDRHQLIQRTVAGATAEAGRALRAFRDITVEAGGKEFNQLVKQATGKTLFQLRQEAQLGLALDSPQQVSAFMQAAQKPNFLRMLLEYWINALISGPKSQMTYGIGNSLLSLQNFGPETALAAAMGAARKRMGREGGTVRLGEVVAALKGAKEGFAPALKAAGSAAKMGVSTLLPGEAPRLTPFETASNMAPRGALDEAYKLNQVMPDLFGALRGVREAVMATGAQLKAGGVQGAPLIGMSPSLRGDIPNIAVKGVDVIPVGEVARLPSRMNAVFDSFFRSLNYSMDKAAQAYRMAETEGLTGTKFDARVAELLANPTSEMMEGARQTAGELSLLDKGGEFTKRVMQVVNTPIAGAPMLKFIAPFVRVASNTVEQTILKRTPVGLLSSEIRADLSGKNGTVAQDRAAARMVMGSALSMLFGSLAAEGLVTGSGPADPREATIWRMAGHQPHSVRIGDFWYDVRGLGPLGLLSSVAADVYDVADKAGEKELDDVAHSVGHAFAQNILDQSFMKGPYDLMKALDQPDRYGPAYIRNLLASFVPFSVASGQVARSIDPYSREARTVVDAMKAKIPGLSQELMPRRDIWGEEIPNKEGALGNLTTLYAAKAEADPVAVAMTSAGYFPGKVERKIRNVDLTDQQYDDYARIAGRMAKQRLDVLVNSADFERMPKFVRHDAIKAQIDSSREVARNVVMMKYPQIAQDAVDALRKARQ
jgi:ribosomal protein S18 acetylase RimI-like enzyme